MVTIGGHRRAQHRQRQRARHDAMGHAAAAEIWRPAGHQRPQHIVTALARLAQAGEPLPRAGADWRVNGAELLAPRSAPESKGAAVSDHPADKNWFGIEIPPVSI